MPLRLRLLRAPAPLLARLRPFSTAAADSLLRVSHIPAPGTGHIRILELNRPAARNAISRDLLTALRNELDDVASHYGPDGEELGRADAAAAAAGPPRALVLASAVDSVFCAGADLKERKTFTDQEVQEFLDRLRSTLSLLEDLVVPTVCAISSLALGGGLELALATHLRVLASTATVGLPETRLGIIPGAGGTHRLPALIGASRAWDMILTGRRVTAPEAYFLGIANRIVEVPAAPEGSEENEAEEQGAGGGRDLPARARRLVLDEAVRLAAQICEGGPIAIRAAVKAVQWGRPEVEDRMYERVLGTEDRLEALRAFQEKRRPEFKGS